MADAASWLMVVAMRHPVVAAVYLAAALALSAAASVASPEASVVTLQYGSFRGNTTGNITSYLGIPYAQAP